MMAGTPIKATTRVIDTEQHKMIRGFIVSEKEKHKGVDLVPKSTNETPAILAYDDGVVIYCGNVATVNQNTGTAGMGTCVAIEHKDGTVTRYQHLKAGSIKVKKGESVKKGQKIAIYGRPTNGNSTGPHLHWDISFPSKPKCEFIKGTFCNKTRYYVDPLPYLTKEQPAADKPAKTEKKVTASLLNVRAGAGKNYPVVETIRRGCVVTILEEKDGFSRIGEGKWCCSDYLA